MAARGARSMQHAACRAPARSIVIRVSFLPLAVRRTACNETK
jgi:hypothetical protein